MLGINHWRCPLQRASCGVLETRAQIICICLLLGCFCFRCFVVSSYGLASGKLENVEMQKERVWLKVLAVFPAKVILSYAPRDSKHLWFFGRWFRTQTIGRVSHHKFRDIWWSL